MKKLVILLAIIWTVPFFLSAQGTVLTLEESVSIALENNASIKAAQERIKEAEAQKGQAFSYFLPKIYGASSYTRLSEEARMGSTVLSDDEIYDYNLRLVQPLFHGGLLPAYQIQKETLKASQNFFRSVQNDLIMEVKRAYFGVLGAEKFKQVAQESLNLTQSHLNTLEAYFREGLIPEVEVLRANVAMANARKSLIEADNNLELAKSYFNNLLNRNLGQEVRLEDILQYKDYDTALSSVISRAINSRPEIMEMRHRLNIAREGVSIAHSYYFPQLSLVGKWGKTKGAELPVDEWEEAWSAVVAMEVDIWDWGENLNEIRKANAQSEQLKHNLTLLVNNIELEARQAYFKLLSEREKIKVQETAVEEAQRNFRDTSLRFKEELSTNTDVLDAQTLLSQAKTNYYQALYEYSIAIAGIERAMGAEISQK